MDAVPLIFVDTVVQLFGEPTLEPLARSVNNTIWKDVIDLHFRNRRYYNVMFKKVEDRFHVGFLGSDRHSSTTDSEEVTILEITEIGDFLKKMAWEVLGLWSLFGDDFDEEMLVKKVDGGRGSSVKAVH
ncbi:hypothetical protein QR680_007633 [Steinernema hermaphroditum]|uniref:Uncharacterized protein n=1 Tax=Steinernema hermaphroditum TaxID=289476 RepID=A0AA39IG82_9BILA|nr:hypothetical protein QR680_007633 [Steinernema hermaphroditum]